MMAAIAEEFAQTLCDLFKEFSRRRDFRVESRKGEKNNIVYLSIGPCRPFLSVRPLYEPFVKIQLDTLKKALAPNIFANQFMELSKVPGFRWVGEKNALQNVTFTRKNLDLVLIEEGPDIQKTRDGLRKWIIGLSEILPSRLSKIPQA